MLGSTYINKLILIADNAKLARSIKSFLGDHKFAHVEFSHLFKDNEPDQSFMTGCDVLWVDPPSGRNYRATKLERLRNLLQTIPAGLPSIAILDHNIVTGQSDKPPIKFPKGRWDNLTDAWGANSYLICACKYGAFEGAFRHHRFSVWLNSLHIKPKICDLHNDRCERNQMPPNVLTAFLTRFFDSIIVGRDANASVTVTTREAESRETEGRSSGSRQMPGRVFNLSLIHI